MKDIILQGLLLLLSTSCYLIGVSHGATIAQDVVLTTRTSSSTGETERQKQPSLFHVTYSNAWNDNIKHINPIMYFFWRVCVRQNVPHA